MFDPTKEMIVLKGEIKTSAVQSCLFNAATHKCEVIFSSGKRFYYANSNVERLFNPTKIDLNEYRVMAEGQPLGNVKAVYAFKGMRCHYYHVVFEKGFEKDYREGEVSFVKTALETKKSKDIWKYFNEIAEISQLRDDEGELILKKQYEKVSFIGQDNALDPYLNAKAPRTRKGQIPIFPFGCNTSQYMAVENAINNQLSVIQGPPGTGKTQTILNIIANLIVSGKNVQVVSNNNSAIENVQEKLASPQYNLDFIVAKLGKSDNKKLFVQEQNTRYPDFSGWLYKGDIRELGGEIQALSQQLRILYADQEQAARLTTEKAAIELEKKHFDEYVRESGVALGVIKQKKNAKAADVMRLWQVWVNRAEDSPAMSLWQKLVLYFRDGLRDFSVFKQDPSMVISSLQALYYEKRLEEIDKEINRLNAEIANMHVDTTNLTAKSMQYFRHVLANRYAGKATRMYFSEDDFWKKPEEVLREYPVTLSTTYASKSSLGSRSHIVQYDYVIMDEASQVDVATGVLAMSSAKNAVIVGDTKQLPNVITEEDREKAESIFKQYDVPEGYKYTKSFLQSVLEIVPGIRTTLLKEHYRCHPKIINFCNQKFYAGNLVVMTKDKGEPNVIKAITTVAGNHERDRFNQRQIDVIKNEILPELGTDLSSVGIITPYRKQVEALRREIPDVDINTVHKFQGREKDTIIISTVDDEKNDFSDDPYLINVAVSRAKKHLYVVASGNETGDGNINDLIAYIRYNNCEVVESKIYSIFDYLFEGYTEGRRAYLKDKKLVSEYDSENLMYTLLVDILKEAGREDIGIVCHLPVNMLIRDRSRLTDEEARYASNPLTHLDFTLYSKISKRILAAIEVDGYTYHKEGTRQAERDLLKNSIMEKYDVPLLRFSTTGSGEKERLREMLERV